MKILNFGSINIDNVFKMEQFVRPGETRNALDFNILPGGKGLNQSIALAKADCKVYHAGKAGDDGKWLVELMESYGVDTSLMGRADCATGKAIIQVNSEGQNCIILYDGANRTMDGAYIANVLECFGEGDMIVLQNEINLVPEIIDMAYNKGMIVVLNPAPMDETIKKCDFNKVSYLLLNEIEGEMITGSINPGNILSFLLAKYPGLKVVLTLGDKGCVYQDSRQKIERPARKVKAVDTTGAGDTFTGFFIKCLVENYPIDTALDIATKAASISVSRQGAAISIPTWKEIME